MFYSYSVDNILECKVMLSNIIKQINDCMKNSA